MNSIVFKNFNNRDDNKQFLHFNNENNSNNKFVIETNILAKTISTKPYVSHLQFLNNNYIALEYFITKYCKYSNYFIKNILYNILKLELIKVGIFVSYDELIQEEPIYSSIENLSSNIPMYSNVPLTLNGFNVLPEIIHSHKLKNGEIKTYFQNNSYDIYKLVNKIQSYEPEILLDIKNKIKYINHHLSTLQINNKLNEIKENRVRYLDNLNYINSYFENLRKIEKSEPNDPQINKNHGFEIYSHYFSKIQEIKLKFNKKFNKELKSNRYSYFEQRKPKFPSYIYINDVINKFKNSHNESIPNCKCIICKSFNARKNFCAEIDSFIYDLQSDFCRIINIIKDSNCPMEIHYNNLNDY